jgi:hypothetical protein
MINICQQPKEMCDAYYKRFESMIQTSCQLVGGDHIFQSPVLTICATPGTPTDLEKGTERAKFLAVLMILRADLKRVKALQEDLETSMNLGRDEYPITLVAAYCLLVREEPAPNSVPPTTSSVADKRANTMSFAQVGHATPVPGTDGRTHVWKDTCIHRMLQLPQVLTLCIQLS